MNSRFILSAAIALGMLLTVVNAGHAQDTAFTYQGRLGQGDGAASGLYEISFTLYDAATNGHTVGTPVTLSPVPVSNGLFAATLDFGPGAFTGAARWLEISVTVFGTDQPVVTLAPRQLITPTPYAIYAARSGSTAIASNVAPGAVSTAAIQSNAVDSSKIADGAVAVSDLNSAVLHGSFWRLDGNAGTTTGPQFLGTTDDRPLELKVNGNRAMRLEPGDIVYDFMPNVIIGSSNNAVRSGVFGSTIGGGSGNIIASGAHLAVIAGGNLNSIDTGASSSSIGGGFLNRISEYAHHSVIAGGEENAIFESVRWAFIGSGIGNGLYGEASFGVIGGGINNGTAGNASVIGGGSENSIAGGSIFSVIGGGVANSIQTNALAATVGGGNNNSVLHGAQGAVIAGGQSNTVASPGRFAFVGGGLHNQAGGSFSTVSGGHGNRVGAPYAIIGGGLQNLVAADAEASVIVGGYLNGVGTNAASNFIGGGSINRIDGASSSAIVGGFDNHLGSYASVISGGRENGILEGSSFSAIAGGENNHIGTNSANSIILGGGDNNVLENSAHAIIAGGRENLATNFAFAAGRRAQALHQGAFVWADSGESRFHSTATNQFAVRATGGIRFATAVGPNGEPAAGVSVPSGSGSWSSLSDCNAKENFTAADARAILEKVAALPVTSWNYKAQGAGVRHLGPTAQDFHATFGLGADNKTIATVDADGVALAAIQGLNAKVDSENAMLRAENADLRRELHALKSQLEKFIKAGD